MKIFLVQKLLLTKRDQGFTIIEIIASLTMVAIISVLIVSRGSFNSADLLGATETLRGHLRYTQSRAMSLDQSWGIKIETNDYILYQNGAPSSGAFPGENTGTVTMSSGITINLTAGASPVTFSSNWGIPTSGYTITLYDGSRTETITVTAETGFVP